MNNVYKKGHRTRSFAGVVSFLFYVLLFISLQQSNSLPQNKQASVYLPRRKSLLAFLTSRSSSLIPASISAAIYSAATIAL